MMGIKETLTLAINLEGSAHFDGEEARELLARLTTADALAEAIEKFLDTLNIPSTHFRSSQREAWRFVKEALREYQEAK